MDRAPLTVKKDGKAIKKINAAQRMHEGLYHEDVVGLEQEYAAKSLQYSEQESKKTKVETTNNTVPDVNEVPTAPENNDVPPVNEVPTINEVPLPDEGDRFEGMYPSALDHQS